MSFSYQVSQGLDFLSTRNVRKHSHGIIFHNNHHCFTCAPHLCGSVYPQRRSSEECPADWSSCCKDLRLRFGPRHSQWWQLHRSRKCQSSYFILILVAVYFNNHCVLFWYSLFYFDRPASQWSGWLQRASFSASTQCRATSGPTESYSGRSSLWVTMATPRTTSPHFSSGDEQYVTFSSHSLRQSSVHLSRKEPIPKHCRGHQLLQDDQRWRPHGAAWLRPGRDVSSQMLVSVLIKLFWKWRSPVSAGISWWSSAGALSPPTDPPSKPLVSLSADFSPPPMICHHVTATRWGCEGPTSPLCRLTGCASSSFFFLCPQPTYRNIDECREEEEEEEETMKREDEKPGELTCFCDRVAGSESLTIMKSPGVQM